jgi:hypothetical protein
MDVFEEQQRRSASPVQQPQQRFEDRERPAAGDDEAAATLARDVVEWPKRLGRGEVLAAAHVRASVAPPGFDEGEGERCLADASLAFKGDQAAPAAPRGLERLLHGGPGRGAFEQGLGARH